LSGDASSLLSTIKIWPPVFCGFCGIEYALLFLMRFASVVKGFADTTNITIG
jgi:hypothetical protein